MAGEGWQLTVREIYPERKKEKNSYTIEELWNLNNSLIKWCLKQGGGNTMSKQQA